MDSTSSARLKAILGALCASVGVGVIGWQTYYRRKHHHVPIRLSIKQKQRRLQMQQQQQQQKKELRSQRQHRSLEDETTEESTAKEEAKAHLMQIVENSLTSALIYVFDKLHLYDILYENGPSTPHEIARLTGWSERWLVELFAQGASAGLLKYHYEDNDNTLIDSHKKFSLREEYADFLRDPKNSTKSMVGLFQVLHHLLYRVEATCNAITTGVGVDYDYGSDLILALDRKNRNFFLHSMIPEILDKVILPQTGEKLTDMLDRGVNVADVGCGLGTSTIVLAKRFPKSHIFAYEASTESLQIIKRRVEEEQLTNITVCDVADRSLGLGPDSENSSHHLVMGDDSEMPETVEEQSVDSSVGENYFSFVYSHDVIHDMTDPRSLINDVRRRLSKDEGCWVIVDIDCHETLSDNFNAPKSALNYGFSCLLCLSCATCEPGGAGLGTMGFSESMARRWMSNAGFQYFHQLKIDSLPYNSCFVVA